LDIKTQCKCGAILKANEKLAGKQAKCPKCGEAVFLPKPDSIHMTCSCGQIIQAKASLAGKRVKCPTCKQPVDIPNVTVMPSPVAISPEEASKSPSLSDALMQLPVTTEPQFHESVWDDLVKTAEKADKVSNAEKDQRKPNPVAKRSAANRQSASLNSVQLGITFIYIGVLLIVAAIIVVVLALLLKAPLLIICGLLLIASSSLLSTIGRILCLTVPKQVGAQALIYFSVAFDVIALFLTVSPMIPGMQNLSGISGLPSVLGTVLFVIFLRKIATYINSDDLAQRASEVLMLWALWVVLFVVGLAVMSLSGFLGMIVVLVLFVLLLLACYRYFQLLSDLRLSLG
jgi:ribosomal protein S27AE